MDAILYKFFHIHIFVETSFLNHPFRELIKHVLQIIGKKQSKIMIYVRIKTFKKIYYFLSHLFRFSIQS